MKFWFTKVTKERNICIEQIESATSFLQKMVLSPALNITVYSHHCFTLFHFFISIFSALLPHLIWNMNFPKTKDVVMRDQEYLILYKTVGTFTLDTCAHIDVAVLQ